MAKCPESRLEGRDIPGATERILYGGTGFIACDSCSIRLFALPRRSRPVSHLLWRQQVICVLSRSDATGELRRSKPLSPFRSKK